MPGNAIHLYLLFCFRLRQLVPITFYILVQDSSPEKDHQFKYYSDKIIGHSSCIKIRIYIKG